MAENVKKRIEQLRKEIRRHDYLYYVLNQPEISDQKYDKLFAELKALEQANPQLVKPMLPAEFLILKYRAGPFVPPTRTSESGPNLRSIISRTSA
ncbi:unnamed protein product, partial [marine sediment metagenome]